MVLVHLVDLFQSDQLDCSKSIITEILLFKFLSNYHPLTHVQNLSYSLLCSMYTLLHYLDFLPSFTWFIIPWL